MNKKEAFTVGETKVLTATSVMEMSCHFIHVGKMQAVLAVKLVFLSVSERQQLFNNSGLKQTPLKGLLQMARGLGQNEEV